jgi:murein DD-endopeptidase MepM/ murein hydrolase activator NlpD
LERFLGLLYTLSAVAGVLIVNCQFSIVNRKGVVMVNSENEKNINLRDKAFDYLVNPFLRRDGSLANKYLDYQSLLDSDRVNEKVKAYITEATGLIPKLPQVRPVVEAAIEIQAPKAAGAKTSQAVPAQTGNAANAAGVSQSQGSAAGMSGEAVAPLGSYSVSSPFGPRSAPTAGASTQHNGIDLAAPAGSPVGAFKGGTVIASQWDKGGGGYYVAIRHSDGTTTKYLHLREQGVPVGAQVNAGQQIGKVGSTGTSTGPHLDFRIQDANGTYLNPANFLK